MKFAKYHGLGNDFVIVDLRTDDPAPSVQDPAAVKAVCDRRFGVGGDGVLAILPGRGDSADARMRVLNADGGEAEMCGNGLRCVAKYLYERDPALRRESSNGQKTLAIDTGAGVLRCEMTVDGGTVNSVTVDMGRPRLTRGEIPMTGPADERCLDSEHSSGFSFTAVSMGNPHAIAFVEESGDALLALAERVGPGVETDEWFPQKTNVEFAKMHGPTDIELLVWERGCGITFACGTGACATAVAACLNGHAKPGTEITVRLLGGTLAITVAEDYSTVFMRGPATHVYDADLDLAALISAD